MPRGVGGSGARQGWGGGFRRASRWVRGGKQRVLPVPACVGCVVGEQRRRGVPAQGWVLAGAAGTCQICPSAG